MTQKSFPSELVSVISPCYNVAPYIRRFLDSLLAQTYKLLEIILVNDGSTDDTGEIIKTYIPLLKAQGYHVIYIEQENEGQSSAINNALKYVTGKFLTWPDPDDWITPDSIEKRLTFLLSRPEVGIVRCNIECIDESSGKSLGLFEEGMTHPKIIDDAYEKLVFVRTWYGSLACMARMSYFDKVVPGREIYVTKRGGQNWQMMLPLAKEYPFWQMHEVLGFYSVRKDSHSHSPDDLEKKIQYNVISEDVLTNTLINIGATSEVLERVHEKYARERFQLAADYSDILKKYKYFKQAIKLTKKRSEKLRLCLILCFPCIVLRVCYKLIHFICHAK